MSSLYYIAEKRISKFIFTWLNVAFKPKDVVFFLNTPKVAFVAFEMVLGLNTKQFSCYLSRDRQDSHNDCTALYNDCLQRSKVGNFIKYWAAFQMKLSNCE